MKENQSKKNIEVSNNIELTNSRLKTIFDNVTDVILIHNAKGELIEINQAGIDRFGIDIINLNKYNVFELVSQEYKELISEKINNSSNDYFSTFESKHTTASGDVIHTENKFKFLVSNNADLFINISRDITEIKSKELEQKESNKRLKELVEERTSQLEDALSELRNEINVKIQAENELIEAKNNLIKSLEIEREYSQLKSRFVSMISHEYRTPLTVILSSTYILEYFFDNKDREKFIQNINKIQLSVQSMTRLLEDVMKIGKSEGELSKVKYRKFDVIVSIEEVISEIKFIEKINHNYELISKYKDLIVNLDEKLFMYIIRNLINNASKYSEKDTFVRIKVDVQNHNLKISISDEGIGIPKDDLKHLFDPFFRSENVGAIEGTGLGLHLTKKYVEALSGEINVDSYQNKGTKFMLTFPIDKMK